jgi:pimeloyl-ACP methyl ester carboxylesterase
MRAARYGASVTDGHSFKWEGRTVWWDQRGGSGPVVVMCHGTPWSSRLWMSYAESLSASHRVLIWDMPGYGRSSKHADHRVDLATQGEVLTALIAHWEIDAPHVVAHDYGGAVALRAHLLHRQPIRSLFLADVVALRPWGSEFFELVKANADLFAQLPAAVHKGVVEAYIRGASYRGLSSEQLDALVEPWTSSEGQAAFYRQIAQASEDYTAEFEPLLSSINVPTRIVWGEQDTWIPADRANRLAQDIPGSTVRLVPDAGHLIQFDQPVRLAMELRHWLDEVP